MGSRQPAFALMLVFFGWQAAIAHPILVDGDASDWVMLPPDQANLGHIARNPSLFGEYVWSDAPRDERNYFVGEPFRDPRYDIVGFRVTGTCDEIYFLIQLKQIPITSGPGAPMIQIAIDVDQDPADVDQRDFFGNAQTQVHELAAWEILLQTRFGTDQHLAVLDESFGEVDSSSARVALNADQGYVEIGVGWSDLGLASQELSSQPLRFSVAVFRSSGTGETDDIDHQSDCLDAVTNYNRPGVLANTAEEVADGIVDYFVDVYFHLDADCEPSPPAVIHELRYDTPTPANHQEWFEIYNRTGRDLDMGGWVISDEEKPGGQEGSFVFPGLTKLGAGQVWVIAQLATEHKQTYGDNPDFELSDSDAAVSDMTLSQLWSLGRFINLNSDGDQLLLLDSQFTILDVVTFEAGYYPGVLQHPGVSQGSGHTLERQQAAKDSNNCAADFSIQTSPTPGQVIGLGELGAACEDSTQCHSSFCVDSICCKSACNGLCDRGCDNLNGSGVCQPVDCSDGDLCTLDACDPDSGCTHLVVDCDDGDRCTSEVCLADSGTCEYTRVDCDDQNACTQDSCSSLAGCQYQPVDCSDGNPCTDDNCDPQLGCYHQHNQGDCFDGNHCTVGDYCLEGSCVSGAQQLVCDDTNPCTINLCDPAVGCQTKFSNAGCDDGNLCTQGDLCRAGECRAGSDQLHCSDFNPCTSDHCDPGVGCLYEYNNADCDDENRCTLGDTCQTGVCLPGMQQLDCDDFNPCTNDSCDPVDGCQYTTNSAGCDDGNRCTQADTCYDGMCRPGAQSLACDDGNPCTTDSCDPFVGCLYENNTVACDDGNLCTQGDSCQAGACQPGPNPTLCDDQNPCTADTCDPAWGCRFSPVANPCDDGEPCTDRDRCLDGLCQGDPIDCRDLDRACAKGVCDPPSGVCIAVALEEGSQCSDGDRCTIDDACTAGLCKGQALDCTHLSDDCHSGVCDPLTGLCRVDPVVDGTACDDQQACTGGDVCIAGNCQGVQKDCSGFADNCKKGVCSSASGQCVSQDLADGSVCDDGQGCTVDDRCVTGVCRGREKACTPAQNPCQESICDPIAGTCQVGHRPNLWACDNGDPCTRDDFCMHGECIAGQDLCAAAGQAGCGVGSSHSQITESMLLMMLSWLLLWGKRRDPSANQSGFRSD